MSSNEYVALQIAFNIYMKSYPEFDFLTRKQTDIILDQILIEAGILAEKCMDEMLDEL